MRKLFAALIALVLSIAGLAAALAGGQSCCLLGVWNTPISGGGGSATLTYEAFATENAGTTTATFNSTAVGATASNRVIVVVAGQRCTSCTGATYPTVASMTVGTHAATQVSGAAGYVGGGLGNPMGVDIWYYADAGVLGTSTNIVVTWTNASTRSAICVYNVTTANPSITNSNNAALSPTLSLNASLTVASNGVGIAGMVTQQTGNTLSFTNATQDVSSAMAGATNAMECGRSHRYDGLSDAHAPVESMAPARKGGGWT